METGGSKQHSQRLSNINPITGIDTNFLKIHSNTVLPSTPTVARPEFHVGCRIGRELLILSTKIMKAGVCKIRVRYPRSCAVFAFAPIVVNVK